MPNRNPVLVYGPRFADRARQFSGPMINAIRERCFNMIEGLFGLDPRIGGFAPSRLTFEEYGFVFRLHRSAPREWVVEIESEPAAPPRRRPRRPAGEATERVAAQAERVRRPRIARQRRMLCNLRDLWITRIGQGTTLFARRLTIIIASWGITLANRRLTRAFGQVLVLLASRTKNANAAFRYRSSMEFVYAQVLTLASKEFGATIGMPLRLSSFEQVSYRPAIDERWDISWFGERTVESELVL